MPLFTSASGVQINGGNFIDIAGDVNLHNMQPAIAQNSDMLSASHQLMGVERNSQNGGVRLVPYGMFSLWIYSLHASDTVDLQILLTGHRF
jgi:hypothetical protein